MPYLELHLHTRAGSADSSIRVDALGERAAEMGTGGLVVTEHFRVWTDWERDAFEARWGVRLYPAIEVTTDHGHIIVVGPEHAERLPGKAAPLLEHAAARGHFTVAAHPFRHYFDRIHASQRPHFPPGLDATRLAELPFFDAIGAIEGLNAICTDRENELASAVGSTLGKPMTFGSDAHHLDEVGGTRMLVTALPADTRELIELLSAL